jgi:hypothetical protein
MNFRTYMLIFCRIFLSNYWWQKSDIWSQASYRYPISWEAFLDLSDSYFLFAEERGYHKWALAHSSSCLFCDIFIFWNISEIHVLSSRNRITLTITPVNIRTIFRNVETTVINAQQTRPHTKPSLCELTWSI